MSAGLLRENSSLCVLCGEISGEIFNLRRRKNGNSELIYLYIFFFSIYYAFGSPSGAGPREWNKILLYRTLSSPKVRPLPRPPPEALKRPSGRGSESCRQSLCRRQTKALSEGIGGSIPSSPQITQIHTDLNFKIDYRENKSLSVITCVICGESKSRKKGKKVG